MATSLKEQSPTLISHRFAHTLSRPISLKGQGLFSGEEISLTLFPSKEEGIVFERVDLAGRPKVEASLENVVSSPRCTTLKKGEAVVQTVEHLLSALKALQIDDVRIEIRGSEIPILDGSSRFFVAEIEEAGRATLERKVPVLSLSAPLFWSEGSVHLIALPSPTYRISYTLHYPHCPLIGSQYYSFFLDLESYKKEIAPCRTFCLYEEIAPLIESGKLKGGNLEAGVVIKENKVLNSEGLRFPDEMVRHKILDLIGDFSLIGYDVAVHLMAVASGHAANVAFAKKILAHMSVRNERTSF